MLQKEDEVARHDTSGEENASFMQLCTWACNLWENIVLHLIPTWLS
jgi:hypothetical protein